jgi:hypothetical protein
MLSGVVRSAIKELSFKTGIYRRTFFERYPFYFSPTQLIFLTDSISQCMDVPGCIVEAGVYQGATTIFLNRFMAENGINKRYVAIDTFAGFTPDHAEHEIRLRSKQKRVSAIFSDNKKSWFDYSMSLSNVRDVASYEADVGKFDFGVIAPIAFCLLDVDFYIPTREALPKIYDAVSPNGIIVVDDCKPGGDWDGALQSYQEFCASRGIKETIVCEKLGVIRKV